MFSRSAHVGRSVQNPTGGARDGQDERNGQDKRDGQDERNGQDKRDGQDERKTREPFPIPYEVLDAACNTYVRDGVTVLRVMSPKDAAVYAQLLEEAVKRAPEYKPGCKPRTRNQVAYKALKSGRVVKGKTILAASDTRHTAGAFGGVNLASVYHSDVVRKLREITTDVAYQFSRKVVRHPVFRERMAFREGYEWYLNKSQAFFLMLGDRAALRVEKVKVGEESHHRDCMGKAMYAACPAKHKLGVHNGGWIALSDVQYFICAPGTNLWRIIPGGFDRLTKEEIERFAPMYKVIKVEPGEMIIFDETIAHRVANYKPATDTKKRGRAASSSDGSAGTPSPGKKRRTATAAASCARKPGTYESDIPPMTRLFTAFAISPSEHKLYGPEDPAAHLEWLNTGPAIPLKSGQNLEYFGPSHSSYHLPLLHRIAKRYTDACIDKTRTYTYTDKKTGEVVTYHPPYRAARSMKQQGLALDTPYTMEEAMLYHARAL